LQTQEAAFVVAKATYKQEKEAEAAAMAAAAKKEKKEKKEKKVAETKEEPEPAVEAKEEAAQGGEEKYPAGWLAAYQKLDLTSIRQNSSR